MGRVDGLTVTVNDTSDYRLRCTVVDVYCEALGWLRREPAYPESVCCRHFWADVEAVAAHG